MLLVDFTTEVGVNASTDIQRKVLLILQILLTYKKLYHRALVETDVIVDIYIAHCNEQFCVYLYYIYTMCRKSRPPTMAITLLILDMRSVHNKNWHTAGQILDAISAFHHLGDCECLNCLYSQYQKFCFEQRNAWLVSPDFP